MSTFVGITLEDGELPESIDGGPGIAKSLAHHLDSLDSMASGLGLRPLGEFLVDFDSQMEEFFAAEGNDNIEDIEKAMAGIATGAAHPLSIGAGGGIFTVSTATIDFTTITGNFASSLDSDVDGTLAP